MDVGVRGAAALGREVRGDARTTALARAGGVHAEGGGAGVPGGALGPGGYRRWGYALGDDALVGGVRRVQEMLA